MYKEGRQVGNNQHWFGVCEAGIPQDHLLYVKEFCEYVSRFCKNRRIFSTEAEALGVGPEFVQLGDIVVALHGGIFPVILRPWNNRTYVVVGPCLFYGQRWLFSDLDRYRTEEHIAVEDFPLV